MKEGADFKDAKGRSPVAYTKVMKKLKLTEAQVLSEVSKYNIPFDDEHFQIPEPKRGRPKKGEGEESDSDSEVSKKRGRPKKEKKVAEASSTEDLFANLISSAVEEQHEVEPEVEEPKKEEPAAKKTAKKEEEEAAAKEAAAKKEKEVAAKKEKEAAAKKEKEAAAKNKRQPMSYIVLSEQAFLPEWLPPDAV